MNLLSLLMGSFMNNQSLGALSQNTGVQTSLLQKIIPLALPLIIKYLTSNASSQSGLSSLFGALGQHQNRNSVQSQIESVDTEDGGKILGHILGEDQEQVIESIAKEAGADVSDVEKVLGNISPSVMSGLSAATADAHEKKAAGADLSDGFDLGDLMSMFGGASAGQASGGLDLSDGFGLDDVMGLFGGAMGGGSKPSSDSALNGTQLINSLLSMMK